MSYTLMNCYYDIGPTCNVSSVNPLRCVTFGNLYYSIAHLCNAYTKIGLSGKIARPLGMHITSLNEGLTDSR